MEAWSRPPHPLAALDAARPLCRTNPIFAEEEEQEVVIVVEENGDSSSSSPELTRTAPQGEPGGGELPRRAPSTSSGYGSGAGSGRSTPPPQGAAPPPPPPMPGLLSAPAPPAPAVGVRILHDAISRKVSAIQTKRDAPPVATPSAVPIPMFSKEGLMEDAIAKQLSTAQNRKKKMKVASRAAPVKLESIFQSAATECALGAAGVHLVAQRSLARPVAKIGPSTCFSNIALPPMPISFQEQLMLRLSQRRKDICSESEEDRASECDVPDASRETLSVLKEEGTVVTAAEVNTVIAEIHLATEDFESPDLVVTRSVQNQIQPLSRSSVRSKSGVRVTETAVDGKPLTSEKDLPGAARPNGDIKLQMECGEEAWEDSVLSSSLRADIRSWLVPRPVWPELGVSALLREAAAAAAAGAVGAAGATLVRARLQAALRALPPAPAFDRCQAVPYCGPGVRPGDVTMMPKHTDLMTHLAASARFTLESDAGAALAARLERARGRRARGRALLALAVLALLLAAVGAAELLLTRGRRLFGTALI